MVDIKFIYVENCRFKEIQSLSKKCPICNLEMPDEAYFCLNCMNYFQDLKINDNKDTKPIKMVHFRAKKCSLNYHLLSSNKKINFKSKKTVAFIATALCVLFGTMLGLSYLNNEVIVQPQDENLVYEEDESSSNKVETFFKEVLGLDNEETKSSQVTHNSNGDYNSSEINNSNENSSATNAIGTTETSNGSSGNDHSGPNDDSNNSSTNGDSDSNTENPEASNNETSVIPSPSEEKFQYTLRSNGKDIEITKYTGNDEVVTIPAIIDGYTVKSINSKTFEDKSVKYIYFETSSKQTSLSISSRAFYNCKNLIKITFPSIALTMWSRFAEGCPNISSLGGITSNSGKAYRYIDGVLYYNTGSTYIIRYICPNAGITTLNIPDWCSGFDSGIILSECKNLKTINMHSACKSFINSNTKCDTLEAINVSDGNTSAFSKNGVLFTKSSSGAYRGTYYPKQNKTKTFTIPENVEFDVYVGSPVNAYLETLYIPKSVTISGQSRIAKKKAFTNLKTIYVQSGSQYEEYFKENFSGTVKVY